MRWAFWRWRTKAATHPPSVIPELSSPTWTAGNDEPADDRRHQSAFSGASPQHSSPPATGPTSLSTGRPEPIDVDLPLVRSDVDEVLRAVLDRDRPRLQEALQGLETRPDDHTSVAAFAVMGLLGELCAAGAGYTPEQAEPGTPAGAAAVAQGDTVAGRADQLLRTLAPTCRPATVRFVVRLSCGGFDELDESVEPTPQELLLVAAVLLAQIAADDQVTADELLTRLADIMVPES